MLQPKRTKIASLDVVSLGPKGGQTVILCHGFGAPGHDLVPLVQMLPRPNEIHYVFPAAPLELGPMYGGGRAWWNIDLMARQQKMLETGKPLDMSNEYPKGLDEARDALGGVIAAIRAEGTGDSQLVIGGFSQGAMLSLDWALRDGASLAGIALLSGTLLCSDTWLPLMKACKSPIFQSHGTQDPILPFAMAEKLRDELTDAGCNNTFVEFQGQHAIPDPALKGLIKSINSWLPKE